MWYPTECRWVGLCLRPQGVYWGGSSNIHQGSWVNDCIRIYEAGASLNGKLHPTYCGIIYMCTFRNLLMLQSLGIFSQSGLSPATSPLMRWRGWSSSAWCSTCTIPKWSLSCLIDRGYNNMWWTWAGRQLRAHKKCLRLDVLASWYILSDTLVQSLKSNVSLSLDAWTSSNRITFLAIIAHYVSNKGELGVSHLLCTIFSWPNICRWAPY